MNHIYRKIAMLLFVALIVLLIGAWAAHWSADKNEGGKTPLLSSEEIRAWPTLEIPHSAIEFDTDQIQMSVNEEVVVIDGSRSFPTTTIQYDSFENGESLSINKKGPGVRFTDSEIDTDGDGQAERVRVSCSGSHCSDEVGIFDGDSLVFRATSTSMIGLRFAEKNTANGFIIEWTPNSMIQGGLCCPLGHVETHFIYRDEKYIPIYEQTIRYIEVKNI